MDLEIMNQEEKLAWYKANPEGGVLPSGDAAFTFTNGDLIIQKAKLLVEKLELVHNDPDYLGVFLLAQNHFGQYRGATYTEELKQLKEVLNSPTP